MRRAPVLAIVGFGYSSDWGSALTVSAHIGQRPNGGRGVCSGEGRKQKIQKIFDNECDQLGRDNYPEVCLDAPCVDRARLREYIGKTALKFFDSNLNVRRPSAN
jgi:hypothetical protein